MNPGPRSFHDLLLRVQLLEDRLEALTRPDPSRLERISREMTRALRHGQDGAAQLMDQSGWIPVELLLGLPGFSRLGASVNDVEAILNSDQRVKRFLMERRSGQLCVSVRQGWSISSGVVPELALETVTAEQLPAFLFHGSYLEREDSIISSGVLCGAELAAMGFGDRSLVHWSLCKPGRSDVRCQFRDLRFKRGTTIVVVVRPCVLQARGVSMFKSDQRSYQGGAVLTGSIKPNLIEQILHYPSALPTHKWTNEETRRGSAEREDFAHQQTNRVPTRW